MQRVSWRHSAADSRLLWALTLASLGGLGAVVVLAAALAAWLVAATALAGDYAVAGILALVLVAGGRFVAPQVAVFTHEQFGLPEGISNRALAAASAAWAAVLVALTALDAPSSVLVAPFVAVFVCMPVVAVLSSRGCVDVDAGTATIRERDVALEDIASVARVDLGPVALLWVRYHAGGVLAGPRLMGVASEDAAAVRAALTASDATAPESDGQRLVAWTLYAFGVGALALAAWLAHVGVRSGGDGAAVGVYGAALAGVFGLLFLWAGRAER